jgi:mRNA-degrading endonuclease RelE of RelBE toxin-antitoxin system
LPARARAQILRKLDRLEHGLHGNIKRLHEAEAMYRLRMGEYRILLELGALIALITSTIELSSSIMFTPRGPERGISIAK